PDLAREMEIVKARAPDLPSRLCEQIVRFIQKLRATDLFKLPGVAETLDWSYALVALDKVALDPEVVDATLGGVLKYQDDSAKISGAAARALLDAVAADVAAGAP